MKPMFRTRMKKMVTEFVKKKEEGGAATAVLVLFLVVVLIVGSVVVAVHFGLTWSSIVSSFQKFFGMGVTTK